MSSSIERSDRSIASLLIFSTLDHEVVEGILVFSASIFCFLMLSSWSLDSAIEICRWLSDWFWREGKVTEFEKLGCSATAFEERGLLSSASWDLLEVSHFRNSLDVSWFLLFWAEVYSGSSTGLDPLTLSESSSWGFLRIDFFAGLVC